MSQRNGNGTVQQESVRQESVRPKSLRSKSVRGNRLAAAACCAAALLAVGAAGIQSAAAHGTAHTAAHTAAHRTAAAAPGLGSAALVQSEDFFQQGLGPVGATVELAGRQGLSACSGEETMRGLTDGGAAAYASVTWTFDTGGLLTESAADAAGAGAASAYATQLDALVRECQDEPAGHWRYGAAHALTADGGTGHWYPSYSGDGTPTGGVAVLRSGTRVAVVELTGGSADAPASAGIEGVATAALNRLPS